MEENEDEYMQNSDEKISWETSTWQAKNVRGKWH
jgi:hypothetical protein